MPREVSLAVRSKIAVKSALYVKGHARPGRPLGLTVGYLMNRISTGSRLRAFVRSSHFADRYTNINHKHINNVEINHVASH